MTFKYDKNHIVCVLSSLIGGKISKSVVNPFSRVGLSLMCLFNLPLNAEGIHVIENLEYIEEKMEKTKVFLSSSPGGNHVL